MKILGMIPARGGSKAIPRKNVRPLAGRSLIEWTFRAAQESGVLDRIVISTDDPEAAAVAKSIGLEVPFSRPADLATDESPMLPVALHTLEALGQEGYRPDALLLLQPTSPLRTPAQIRRAVELLKDGEAVCSVIKMPQGLSPHYLMKVEDGLLKYFMPDGPRYTRRQDVPPAYKRDGTIFLTRTEVLQGQRSFYGQRCIPMVLDEDEILNIDDLHEWEAAEKRLGS